MNGTPWLVIGAGAIGLFWACKLQTLGYTVHLVYRSKKPKQKILLDALIDTDGHQQSNTTEHKIKSFTPAELTKTYDKVLICTKSFDLTNAYSQASKQISENAIIACLCNGVGAQQELQNILLDTQTLWAAITSEGALKIDTSHVKHTGLGDTYFGQWQQEKQSESFPIDHLTVTNIHQRIIEKLAVNTVINPITAIFNIRNGDILSKELTPLIKATLSELASVFTHPKFPYIQQSKHLTQDNLHNRVSTVAQLTRLNQSSMYEDVKQKRQTENDYISGFLLKNSPIELPIQQLLYDGIAFSERREEIKKKLLNMV